MGKLLLTAKKKLTLMIPVMIVLGLIVGYQVDVRPMKGLVTPILFIMVFPMMLNVSAGDLLEVIKAPRAILVSLAVNFTLVPLLAYSLGHLFFQDRPMLFVGMMLIGLIPTSGMTASWTGLARGRVQTALVMMTVNLLFSIVMIPIVLGFALSAEMNVPTGAVVMSLVKVVLLPLAAANLTRGAILRTKGEAYFKEMKPYLGGVSAIGVMAVVWLAIALKAKTIMGSPMLAISIVWPLVIFYGLLIVLSHVFGRALDEKGDRIALVYGTSMRNLTIVLGVALTAFGESLAVLLIAIAYVVQLPAAVFYMKYIERQEAGISAQAVDN